MEGFHFGNPGDIHESLKQTCLDHILAAYSAMFSDKSSGSLDLSANHISKLDNGDYPFLRYAVMNVLLHSDRAYRGGISQTAFLQEFPTHKWTCLYNVMKTGPKFKIYEASRPSMLYLLAQFDAHHLLRDHPELRQQFKLRGGAWGYPWRIAAKAGNMESLRHLVNAAVVSPSSHVTSQEVSALSDKMNSILRIYEQDRFELGDAVVAARLAAFGHGPLLENSLVQVGSRHCECQETPMNFKTGSQICRTKVHNMVNTRLASIVAEWEGRTAIFWVRTAEALEVLLAYGADPNVQDDTGKTAVHTAVCDISLHGIERLEAICSVQQVKLKVPCSTCSVEPALENIIHTTDHSDCLLQPLAPRFDINIRDKFGRTALSLVAGYYSAKVQLLLDAFPDIDIHLLDNNSRSPLSYAVGCSNIEAVQLLLSRYSEADLQHLNRPDKDGRTIVSYAADTEKAVDILRLLLAKFPQIALDTPDNKGWTPLRWAVEDLFDTPSRSLRCIKSLLASGQVNPFHPDKYGFTPFGMAKRRITHSSKRLPIAREIHVRRDIMLEMIKTAENKEVMSKFHLEDEDLRRIEEEIEEARKVVEEMDFYEEDREQSELDEF